MSLNQSTSVLNAACLAVCGLARLVKGALLMEDLACAERRRGEARCQGHQPHGRPMEYSSAQAWRACLVNVKSMIVPQLKGIFVNGRMPATMKGTANGIKGLKAMQGRVCRREHRVRATQERFVFFCHSMQMETIFVRSVWKIQQLDFDPARHFQGLLLLYTSHGRHL